MEELKDCATCVFKDTQMGGYPCRECYKDSHYKPAYCHCRTKSTYDLLDTDNAVVYINFDGKKIVAVTFDDNGRCSGRKEFSIKYCPFCGNEL